MSSNQYFAAQNAVEATTVLLSKANGWTNNLESNGYLDKLRMSWAAYHGAYYSDVSSGHQITFGGEQGELVNLPVNHIRNLALHILNMATSTRPTMEARSVNTDYKSLSQAILANGLLDYYMREKRLEKYLKNAVESAIVLGSGYIKMSWNATSGEVFDYNEDTNTPIYEGDVEFSNLYPFDVVVDGSKEHQDHDWVLTRSWKNKFDLIAKYPELESKLRGLETKTEFERIKLHSLGNVDTDDVAIYEFYHKRSEALPDGRYILFGSTDTVMYDGPLPYRFIPVFRISPSDIMGTPYGYTTIFDILPLQEAINSLYSAVLTNQTFGAVQNIIVPRGCDVVFSQLPGGLNIIEANTSVGKPEALNLTSTPPEVFKMIDMLERTAETLSGVNQVARGNPEASLKSGAALALVQSMAIQFMNGLQQSYVQLIEDVGTGLISMLKDFAAVPRVAAITGKANRTYMKEFKGEDLSSINRVIVDVGNPLARTTAGRVQMAEQLLQMGAIKDVNQFLTIINTGKLEVSTEGTQSELTLIKEENEKLMNGQEVPVLPIDTHIEHIMEHKAVLANPDLRSDAVLVNIVLNHIQEHIDALRTVDPGLLMALGQQPIPPVAPPGAPEGAPGPGGGAPSGAPIEPLPQPGQPNLPSPAETMDEAVQAVAPGTELPNMPNMPTPPAPFQNLPTNPNQMVQG